jgi:heme-degrading monooxygenase HmoA
MPLDIRLSSAHGCVARRVFQTAPREGPHRTMDTMTDTGAYTSGDWWVRAGSEEAFVARWREFLEYARASAPGFVAGRLYRDVNDARHFVSLGVWESLATQAAWRGMPDFAAKLGACQALCETDRNSMFTLAAEVL